MFSNKSANFTSIIESLEERVLFDGVPDATFLLPSDSANAEIPVQTQLEQAEFSAPRELVLIDAGVQDGEQLLASLLESKSESALEIRFLDADSDGVQQISEILSSANYEYDAIHILSHGDEGQVSLGNTVLSADNLSEYADELAGWADALTEEADLLFYGCELAGNEDGEQFIESISAMTGADVAASDDITGSAVKGGDWELETTFGDVETETLEANGYTGILADNDGDGVDDFDDLDDDNDGILDSDETVVSVTNAITSGALNSPGFPVDTPLQTANQPTGDGTTAQLSGLFGGLLDFEATLLDDGVGTAPTWANGVQIQNDATTGDFIFVQPENTSEFRSDFAQYTFDFNGSVENFSFLTVGLNNSDTVIYEAFFEGVAVPITAANFSNLDPGVVVQNGNELIGTSTAGGTGTISNVGRFSISQPIDQLILSTGKSDGTDITVTLAFADFSGDVSSHAILTDTDGDGIHDGLDQDSDNDGISDLHESGNAVAIAADTNQDGLIDAAEATAAGLVDANQDGVWDTLGTTSVDTDNDGIQDYLDLDSDNDGIADAIEAQATAGYQSTSIGSDADGDGVVDTFDDGSRDLGGNFTTPEDTDGDGIADYLDTDSDNDGLSDSAESGLTLSGNDANGDGIDDAAAPNSYQDTDGIVSNPFNDLENATDNITNDVDYRSVNDKDWDGIGDPFDLDDDNDGILDSDEFIVQSTTALSSTALNSPGFPTDTPLQSVNQPTGNGTSAQLQGLLGGLLDFEATLLDDGAGTSPTWSNGVQIQNDATSGDFIFVQPQDTSDFPDDIARYTFDFNSTVENFSFLTIGLNNSDTVTYQAFFQGVEVPITAANFSNLDPGVLVQNGNQLIGTSTAGGTGTISNVGRFSITQPIDQLVLSTGKSDNTDITVTLAFADFSGDAITTPQVLTDTDGDGIHDGCDHDSDNDGISDLH